MLALSFAAACMIDGHTIGLEKNRYVHLCAQRTVTRQQLNLTKISSRLVDTSYTQTLDTIHMSVASNKDLVSSWNWIHCISQRAIYSNIPYICFRNT